MRKDAFDIVILGSGFAGSLLATIARKLGRSVLLVERGRHPRFAIGESTTPLANLLLARLADDYDLPWLRPLAKYGPWKRSHPELTCGPKRGFSFFRQRPGRPFQPTATNESELMVGANPDVEHADTHWLRADVDAFFVRQAIDAGVSYADMCETTEITHDGRWRLDLHHESSAMEIETAFLVDATGGDARVASALGLRNDEDRIITHSRALFTHFDNVALWSDVLAELGGNAHGHPYPCDAAAFHHVIDAGWMWVLRFDNGVVSAGFSLDPRRYPLDADTTPADEWVALVNRYPSIQRQFAAARALRPIVRTNRLQSRLSPAAGADWAALPHSVAFVDPWLSPGIAHSLFAVAKLSRVFGEAWSSPDRADRLSAYSRSVMREASIIDRITAACFERFDCFPLLTAMSMLYFAAVTYLEGRMRAGRADSEIEFLLAHDERFVALVNEVADAGSRATPGDAEEFNRHVAKRIAPYNIAGLCDPSRRNMYPHAS
jgi:FADH2 O2-dependent halogenase